MSTLIAAAASLLVFCAPGYPGTSADAQPLVGEFAATLAAAAGWPAGSLTAVYDASDTSDLARLAAPEAGLAFVPYPFYVQHGAQLHMVPLAQAVVPPAGCSSAGLWCCTRAMRRRRRDWRVSRSSAPQAMRRTSSATLLHNLGALPADHHYHCHRPGAFGAAPRGQRRAGRGAARPGADQMPSPVCRSPRILQASRPSAPVPVALIVVVDGRIPKARAQELSRALLHLSGTPPGAATLSRLKLNGFVPPRLPTPRIMSAAVRLCRPACGVATRPPARCHARPRRRRTGGAAGAALPCSCWRRCKATPTVSIRQPIPPQRAQLLAAATAERAAVPGAGPGDAACHYAQAQVLGLDGARTSARRPLRCSSRCWPTWRRRRRSIRRSIMPARRGSRPWCCCGRRPGRWGRGMWMARMVGRAARGESAIRPIRRT